jgi:hypothetical protein
MTCKAVMPGGSRWIEKMNVDQPNSQEGEAPLLDLPVPDGIRREPPLVSMAQFLHMMIWGRKAFPKGIPTADERAAAKNDVEFVYLP